MRRGGGRKETVESYLFICFSCKPKWQQGGQLTLKEIQGILPHSIWHSNGSTTSYTLVLSHATGSCLLQRHSGRSTPLLWLTSFGLLSSHWSPCYLILLKFLLSSFQFSATRPCPCLVVCLSQFFWLTVSLFWCLTQTQHLSLCVLSLWLCVPYLRILLFILTAFRNTVTRFLPRQHIILPQIYILPTCLDHIAHSGSGLCWAV